MNEDVKRQWISALRSGEYKQGYQRLERNGEFCCLGVLCDLAVKAGVVERVHGEYGHGVVGFARPGDPEGPNASTPPWAVVKWAGMVSDSDSLEMRSLINLNDIKGLSFEEIADVIEERL